MDMISGYSCCALEHLSCFKRRILGFRQEFWDFFLIPKIPKFPLLSCPPEQGFPSKILLHVQFGHCCIPVEFLEIPRSGTATEVKKKKKIPWIFPWETSKDIFKDGKMGISGSGEMLIQEIYP